MMHLHRWSKWEDVKLGERAVSGVSPGIPAYVLRQVISQQRRCSVCNMVESRYSA